MALSQFTRVASEGDTIDGRVITAQQIREMADTYSPKVYGARVWPEHFRGVIPGSPFDPLGDVVAAKAEVIKDGTRLDGKLGLYVQVDALPSMVALNAEKKKIFSSIEVITNFAKSGKAYLVGLAATDSPSSLGTQMFAFANGGPEVLAGVAHETNYEFADQANITDENREGTPTIFERVKGMFSKSKSDNDGRFNDVEAAIGEIATFAQGLEKRIPSNTVPRADFDALKKAHEDLASKFEQVSKKLEFTEQPGRTERTPASGGNGGAKTDC